MLTVEEEKKKLLPELANSNPDGEVPRPDSPYFRRIPNDAIDSSNEALSTPNASLKAIPRALSDLGLGMPTIGGSLVDEGKVAIPNAINYLNGNPTRSTVDKIINPTEGQAKAINAKLDAARNIPLSPAPQEVVNGLRSIVSIPGVSKPISEISKPMQNIGESANTETNDQMMARLRADKDVQEAIAPFAQQRALQPKMNGSITQSDGGYASYTVTPGTENNPIHPNNLQALANRKEGQPVTYKNDFLNVEFPGNTSTSDIRNFTNSLQGSANLRVEEGKAALAHERLLAQMNGGRGPGPSMPTRPDISGMRPNEAKTVMAGYEAELRSYDNAQQNMTTGKYYDANNANNAEQNRINEDHNKSTGLRELANTDSEIAYRNAQIKAMKNPIDAINQLTAHEKAAARNDAMKAFQEIQKNPLNTDLNAADWLRDSPYSNLFPEYDYKKSPQTALEDLKKYPSVWKRYQESPFDKQQAILKQQRLR